MAGNTITTVVYLLDNPLTKRDFDRFGIERVAKNFEVEVWSFAHVLRRESFGNVKDLNTANWKKFRSFGTMDEAVLALKGLSECFVVCLVPYLPPAFPIYRQLSKNNLRYAVFMANAVPEVPPINNAGPSTLNFLKKLGRLQKITPGKVLNAFIRRIPFQFLGIKPADVVLTGGKASLHPKRYPISKDTNILKIHSLDYDIYLDMKEGNKKDEGKKTKAPNASSTYALFLDEFLPFHSDYSFINLKPPSKPETYYPLMKKFFDLTEKKYGMKVVVAAHPRSDYDKRSTDYYDSRQVIKDKSAELIRNSSFVIAHSSTSVGLAVLFRKPIFIISTKEIQSSWQGVYIDMMSKELGTITIVVDGITIKDLPTPGIDEKAYEDYIEKYLKQKGTPEIHFWDVFVGYLKTSEVRTI